MTRSWRQDRVAVGVVASALLATAAGGCAAHTGAADKDTDFKKYSGTSSVATAPVSPSPSAGAAPAAAAPADARPAGYREMPTPPPDAEYTIYCQAYAGQDHAQVARRVRDLLFDDTKMNKWYVVDGDQQTILYYGFYRTIDKRDVKDGAEGQRALDDLDAIRTLHDSRGSRLFSASLPVSINAPDPTANPAWDITRSGGYWSLEVETFTNTADRKQLAVEDVAAARAKGFPAYYYHGPHASSVCIGAWPQAAAIDVDVGAQVYDPSKTVVVTGSPMDPKYASTLGDNVQAAAPHVDPVDPSMLAAIARWPDHATNGATRMKADAHGKATDVAVERSFLFKIPAGTGLVAGGGADDGVPAADPTAVPVDPGTAAAEAGAGQLHSLGDSH